jgi:hypothetical protein
MYHRDIETIGSVAYVELDRGEQTRLTSAAEDVVYAAAQEPDLLNYGTSSLLLPSALLDLLTGAVPVWPPQYSGWLLRGIAVDDGKLGRTPPSWRHAPRPPAVEDCQLLMLADALGDVYGWADQQAGAPVHNIIPVVGEEKSLLSSSSEAPLALHTEDAYFDERADFVVLLCLRNPSGAATYIADVRHTALSQAQWRILESERFFIESDGSHGQGGERVPANGFPVVEHRASPEMAGPTAVVSADVKDPWLRIDIDHLRAPGDRAASEAAVALDQILQDARTEVVLQPGDVLIIDNRCTVHGRGRFLANYSGGDRWLKRVNVACQGRNGIPPRPALRDGAAENWRRMLRERENAAHRAARRSAHTARQHSLS